MWFQNRYLKSTKFFGNGKWEMVDGGGDLRNELPFCPGGNKRVTPSRSLITGAIR